MSQPFYFRTVTGSDARSSSSLSSDDRSGSYGERKTVWASFSRRIPFRHRAQSPFFILSSDSSAVSQRSISLVTASLICISVARSARASSRPDSYSRFPLSTGHSHCLGGSVGAAGGVEASGSGQGASSAGAGEPSRSSQPRHPRQTANNTGSCASNRYIPTSFRHF